MTDCSHKLDKLEMWSFFKNTFLSTANKMFLNFIRRDRIRWIDCFRFYVLRKAYDYAISYVRDFCVHINSGLFREKDASNSDIIFDAQ